jgi:hypothetical protein
MEYAIFVPKRLLPAGGRGDYKFVLQSLPLVRHSPEGEFVQRMNLIAQQEKVALNNCLTCEGFPQVCRAIQSGTYAGVLPTIARGDLKSGDFIEVDWPALKAESRWIVLAWNPRQVGLRAPLEMVASCLKAELGRGL